MNNDLSHLTTESLERELAKRQKVKEIASKLEENPLKCKTISYISVSYSDLESFIYKIFGREYDSADVNEVSNDNERKYSVTGLDDGEYNRTYTIPEIENYLFNDSKEQPRMSYLLDYLASKNYIPKGEYLVSWSW